jgi:hypothetical protein
MNGSEIAISGIVSFHMFQFENKYYYLFGDSHTSSVEGNCFEKYNYLCDSYDYTYENVLIKNSNCWEFGSLLDEWFTYNNINNIKTDFYLEVPFTKASERSESAVSYDIYSRREEFEDDEIEQTPKATTESWLKIFPILFEDCLVYKKKKCKYYPNVRFHYLDVRQYDEPTFGYVVPDVFVFNDYNIDTNLSLLYEPDNDRDVKQATVNLFAQFSDLSKIITTLLNNNIIVLDLYMSNKNPYETLKFLHGLKLTSDIGRHFYKKLESISNMVVQRDTRYFHRTANEFLRLVQIRPDIAAKLFKFTKNELQKIIKQIRLPIKKTLDKIFLELGENNPSAETIWDLFTELLEYLGILSIWNMDIYTLSRLFLHNHGNQVIIFAGYIHINNYYKFMKILGASIIIDSPSEDNNNRCIISSEISRYLPLYDFRNISTTG